jgi:hypothetical protein
MTDTAITVPVMTVEQQLEYRTMQLEFVQLRSQAQELQVKLQAVAKRMNDAILSLAGTTEGLSFNQETLVFTFADAPASLPPGPRAVKSKAK